MSTAPYIAFATLVDRVAAWWEAKRLEWQLQAAVVDEVAKGWVPTREQVGLPPEPSEVPEPDEFEESRPVDLDDCERCGGTGIVQLPGVRLGHPDSYVDCRVCGGTGDRTTPTVFRGWAL